MLPIHIRPDLNRPQRDRPLISCPSLPDPFIIRRRDLRLHPRRVRQLLSLIPKLVKLLMVQTFRAAEEFQRRRTARARRGGVFVRVPAALAVAGAVFALGQVAPE